MEVVNYFDIVLDNYVLVFRKILCKESNNHILDKFQITLAIHLIPFIHNLK